MSSHISMELLLPSMQVPLLLEKWCGLMGLEDRVKLRKCLPWHPILAVEAGRLGGRGLIRRGIGGYANRRRPADQDYGVELVIEPDDILQGLVEAGGSIEWDEAHAGTKIRLRFVYFTLDVGENWAAMDIRSGSPDIDTAIGYSPSFGLAMRQLCTEVSAALLWREWTDNQMLVMFPAERVAPCVEAFHSFGDEIEGLWTTDIDSYAEEVFRVLRQ